jgi:hypothetical protein
MFKRHAVGHRLQKRSARPVRVKAKTSVKNEARKDERGRVHQECDGNEDEVGESQQGKDLEVRSLSGAPKYQHGNVK